MALNRPSSRPNSKSQVIVLTLIHEGLTPIQVATRFGVCRQSVHRLLLHYKAGGLEALEPKKRPKAYFTRFEAAQPNETWHSYFTHWRLGLFLKARNDKQKELQLESEMEVSPPEEL